ASQPIVSTTRVLLIYPRLKIDCALHIQKFVLVLSVVSSYCP
ncbi:MAG: hypothetical protein ACI9UJ_001328, partial [bacterium]